METCKVAPCIVYEAATIWLIGFVLANKRFWGPRLLRALGGPGALSGRAAFFSKYFYYLEGTELSSILRSVFIPKRPRPGAAQLVGAGVLLALIRGGCARFLFGLALAYVLKGKHFWNNLAAQWAATKKERGQGAPKHQSIFASVISIFLF